MRVPDVCVDVRYNPAVAVHRSVSSPTAPFTKGEVNRAGVLLLDLRERMQRDGAECAEADSDEKKLDEAWEALTWWRSLHARPLSAVAANLRYHVDRSDARVLERIEVTQRLKRLDTLIGKLGRERGNVTQMQDIGGVRAVVPSLRHVYVARRRLLKSWVTPAAEVLGDYQGAGLHRRAKEQWLSGAASDRQAHGLPD